MARVELPGGVVNLTGKEFRFAGCKRFSIETGFPVCKELIRDLIGIGGRDALRVSIIDFQVSIWNALSAEWTSW
ncbi:MAG: hypothetical protein LUQ50_04975 [Methanospirillum sp.]|uniref:hypothetical protein n=1 Tax=Methanospirillum sp. TaxID=45200 RepID=UPI00236D6FBC|nr:hypothetical protein [Methanospirillum sp.]MDD1728409.1 hypothetical protein [Methanospirillum sp.]